MELDHRGEVVGQEFTAGVIRSAERMTYTNVHLLLEGDAAMRERYQPLVARFELMQELALVLNKKRVRRGSIDFDLPEPLIEFDELGAMTGVTRAPRNIANRIIEEFMLAANESVAGHLEQAGIASVYRIHEMPDPKRYGIRGNRHPLRRVARHRRDSREALRRYRQASRWRKKRRDVVVAHSAHVRVTRSWCKIEQAEERILIT